MTWWLETGCIGPNVGDACYPPIPCDVECWPPGPPGYYHPFLGSPPLPAGSYLGPPPLPPGYIGAPPSVGACCGSCASGGACEAACPDKRVGAIVEKAIQFSDIAKSDATIGQFNAQVVATPGAGPDAVGTSTGPFGTFPSRWYAFNTSWTVWFGAIKARNADIQASSFGVAPEIVTGDGAETYEKLMLDFNILVDEFKKSGGKTTVEPIDTRSPAEKGLAGVTEGIFSGLSSAGSGLATVLTYVAVAGAVGLGLYIAGPYLLTHAGKAIRKLRPA